MRLIYVGGKIGKNEGDLEMRKGSKNG